MSANYRGFAAYLMERYGQKTRKITVNAGFTCPNRDGTISTGGCLYCNEAGSGNGKTTDIGSQVRNEINRSREKGWSKFIVYFQSFTNTYAPASRLKQVYDSGMVDSDIVGLSIGTRPDCIDEEKIGVIGSYLKAYDVWVEIGLQTANERTLYAMNRGHGIREFIAAFEMLRRAGIKVCVHIIFGLPGEEREDMLETSRLLARLKPDGLKIHSLYVEKGSRLDGLHARGEFQFMSMEEYVSMCCDCLELQHPDVIIQRLTGDSSSNLAGPDWVRDKSAVLRAIDSEFVRRKSHQGSRHSGIF